MSNHKSKKITNSKRAPSLEQEQNITPNQEFMSDITKEMQNYAQVNKVMTEKIEENYQKINSILNKIFIENLEHSQKFLMCNNFKNFLEISENIFETNVIYPSDELMKITEENINNILKIHK